MYPLQDFFNRANEVEKETKMNIPVKFDEMNRDTFKNLINRLQDYDDHDLAVLIKNNLDNVARDIMNNDPAYSQLLVNQRFISAFMRAVASVPLDYTVKLACNKITYDYFTSEAPLVEIKQQYLNLSRIVNRDYINRLIGIGLDENTACNLALCRFSSSNEKTNCKRLNFTIYNKDPEVMTEQMVVWIYEKLFSSISDLFQAVMFEVYSERQQNDFGENFMEIYGVVGLAVLLIVNNMPSDKIQKVLFGYASEWEYLGKPPVRFTLRALSADYSKISRVVDYLESMGTYVP